MRNLKVKAGDVIINSIGMTQVVKCDSYLGDDWRIALDHEREEEGVRRKSFLARANDYLRKNKG